MTFPSDVVDSARRRMARRNSLGNERTVTFSKPSPERNSVSSTRSIKEYTTTQSVKGLSVDSSEAGDEVTSKAIITKTSSILRTPKSLPAKTYTARNQLEPPKTSYNRTYRSEVFHFVPFFSILFVHSIIPVNLFFIYLETTIASIIACACSVHTTLVLFSFWSFRVIKILSWCSCFFMLFMASARACILHDYAASFIICLLKWMCQYSLSSNFFHFYSCPQKQLQTKLPDQQEEHHSRCQHMKHPPSAASAFWNN